MVLVLPKSLTTPEKNHRWSGNFTPNVALRKNQEYIDATKQWARKWGVRDTKNLFEVRVVKATSRVGFSQRQRWWDDPMWMDKIFWVYQAPISLPKNRYGEHVQFYALEMFENKRVVKATVEQFGYNPFPSWLPALLIPVECVELCWDDTEAGYSRHCREPIDPPKTQEQIEKEQQVEEVVREIQKDFYEVSNDPKWGNHD